MVNRFIKIIITTLVIFTGFNAYAAKIAVTSDRTEIQENESFTLEYSSDSSVDDEPDFSPIEKNFHIISRSQSSNIQFINGRLDRKTTWVLVLMPKATGKFTIPAINFGSDKSGAVSIKVTKATASKSTKEDLVYIEAFADTNSAYVQSQIIYTLRIFHAVRFRNASLSEMELSDKDANIEKLEENKKYSKFINGRRYEVFEKRYAIFPQSAGRLTIEPAVLDVQYIEAMRTLRNKRIVSDKITVDVKPVPQVIKNKNLQYWLPASNIMLEEKWSGETDDLQVGEPLTRTVTLTAKGLLSSALPDLSTKFPVKGLKHYPDQPSLDNKIVDSGFVGKRQEKIAYIPSQPGRVTLPELEIVWWDTQKNKMQKAVLPAREIIVAGGANQLSDGSMDNDQAAKSIAGDTSISTNQVTNETPATGPENINIAGVSKSVWFWVSMLLLLLWAATIGLWLNARKDAGQSGSTVPKDNREPLYSADGIKAIKAACDNNDPHQTKEALLAWGKLLWQDSPPTSLGHIAERVNRQLSKELQKLNTALYKPGVANWDRNALLSSLQKYVDEQQKKQKTDSSRIKPLFRIATNQ